MATISPIRFLISFNPRSTDIPQYGLELPLPERRRMSERSCRWWRYRNRFNRITWRKRKIKWKRAISQHYIYIRVIKIGPATGNIIPPQPSLCCAPENGKKISNISKIIRPNFVPYGIWKKREIRDPKGTASDGTFFLVYQAITFTLRVTWDNQFPVPGLVSLHWGTWNILSCTF